MTMKHDLFWQIAFFCTLSRCCTIPKRVFHSGKLHVAALILARGGSKGIELKNLARVNGRTLLRVSLDVVLRVDGFDSIWVSTDNKLIYEEAIEAGRSVNVHWRSDESATDTATSVFAVKEFLKYHPEVDVVALVQCTSPLVRVRYLQKALSYVREGKECAFSVTRSYKLRWKVENDLLQPLNFDVKSRPRRQDWEGEFVENGMFYFARRELIEKDNVLQSNSLFKFWDKSSESEILDYKYCSFIANVAIRSLMKDLPNI